VSNLGHNPVAWTRRFWRYMGWPDRLPESGDSFLALPMTAYNSVTPIEVEASRRLVELLQRQPGGARCEQVLWAASGSEAIQKALWAALDRRKDQNLILSTRHGFHGKKGLAGAVTGTEYDAERDSRVRFISFPHEECINVARRKQHIDLVPYEAELSRLWDEYGSRI